MVMVGSLVPKVVREAVELVRAEKESLRKEFEEEFGCEPDDVKMDYASKTVVVEEGSEDYSDIDRLFRSVGLESHQKYEVALRVERINLAFREDKKWIGPNVRADENKITFWKMSERKKLLWWITIRGW